MIPTCHVGIQKLHIHWKYPSGSGIYSHTVRHFPAASPSTAKRSTVDSTLFTVTAPQGHVNHVITIMNLPSFTEFWNLYCPRTIHFSLRRWASLRTQPTTLLVRDWGNNGTICDSTCAARCRLQSRFLLYVSCYRRKIWALEDYIAIEIYTMIST